jgi:hypothetical protein
MPDQTITRGDTEQFTITVIDADGDPQNLAGCTLFFTARRQTFAGAIVIAKKSPSDGIVIDSPSTLGTATLTISPTDTASVERKLLLAYDVQLKDGADNIYTIDTGEMILEPDVTTVTA